MPMFLNNMQQHDVLFNNIIFFYYIMEIQHLAIERLDFLQKILNNIKFLFRVLKLKYR